MARPRGFDEAEVLDRALEIFWRKGFEGTSIADLLQATGLARASLYGVFGDKVALYRRVLDRYLDRASWSAPGERVDDPGRTLRDVGAHWVQGCCPTTGPKGCFLSLAGTDGASPAFARELLFHTVARHRDRLEPLIRQGQRSGVFRSDRSAENLAMFLVVLHQGIAASARAGMAQSELFRALDEALVHVFASAPGNTEGSRRPKN